MRQKVLKTNQKQVPQQWEGHKKSSDMRGRIDLFKTITLPLEQLVLMDSTLVTPWIKSPSLVVDCCCSRLVAALVLQNDTRDFR